MVGGDGGHIVKATKYKSARPSRGQANNQAGRQICLLWVDKDSGVVLESHSHRKLVCGCRPIDAIIRLMI